MLYRIKGWCKLQAARLEKRLFPASYYTRYAKTPTRPANDHADRLAEYWAERKHY